MFNNEGNDRMSPLAVDITSAHDNYIICFSFRSLREVRDAYFLRNGCFQCFMLDIRDQQLLIQIFGIPTPIESSAAIYSLLIVLAVEISLWIGLRQESRCAIVL